MYNHVTYIYFSMLKGLETNHQRHCCPCEQRIP